MLSLHTSLHRGAFALHRLSFRGVAVLACAAGVVSPVASQPAWTRFVPVYDLAGAGDILAAATAGGVVFWDLSSGGAYGITTAQGLPTQVTLAASLAPDRDQLCVATTNGIARGWIDAGWEHLGAQSDEKGLATYATLAWPAGRCIAGGDNGQLIHWGRQRADSLRVPTRSGRVVGLALFTSWFDGTAARSTATLAGSITSLQHTGEPGFPVGLVAALDNDGVWLLRDSGPSPRWLRFVQEDGLPSHRARDVLVDRRGRLWVATDAGVAWIGSDLVVRAFPGDSLLQRRTNVLREGRDGRLYVGFDNGVARVDLDAPERGATLVLATAAPVIALAPTADDLWWSDGTAVAALGGARLETPLSIAASFCLAVSAWRDSLWVGHPGGGASVSHAGTWAQLGGDNGLPADDVISFLHEGERLFLGTAAAGLFERTAEPASGLPRLLGASIAATSRAAPHFAPVAGAPAHVAAQTYARGLHWVGGSAGLQVHREGAWQHTPLWPGAYQVVDLLASGDTLWASAAYAGVAYHDGQGWITLPRSAELATAYCGPMRRSPDGRLVVGTDRGLATWSHGILCAEPGFPNAFVTAVEWWGEALACGTHRGLWIRSAPGDWSTLGVLEGVPGAQIRALATDSLGALWVGTTRGLGRLWPATTGAAPGLPARHGRVVPPGLAGDDDQPTHSWIAVYDVRGRLVQRLDPRRNPHWDGRDTQGRSVARGVYFLRPERIPARGTRRVVVRR